MASETKWLTNTGSLSEVRDWLAANATEYFDSFVLSEDGLTLDLQKASNTYITITTTAAGSVKMKFTVYGGATHTTSHGSSESGFIERLTKTDYGICISVNYGGTSCPRSIFITKTNNGNIGAVIFHDYLSTKNTSSNYAYAISFSTSTEFVRMTATGGANFGVNPANLTTLCPIVCMGNSDEYMPNIFITPFSQYVGTECSFVFEGTEYLYNGYIALKD